MASKTLTDLKLDRKLVYTVTNDTPALTALLLMRSKDVSALGSPLTWGHGGRPRAVPSMIGVVYLAWYR